MASDWQDLYVRTDLAETSPDDRRGGVGSPDIIPTGLDPANPDDFITEESYRRYYNLPLQAGKANYLYVRAKNSSPTGSNKGQAYLVMTDPAVVLWPGGDKWTSIKTNNGNLYSQLEPSPVSPKGLGVTRDPFVLVPTESGHRCVVTWLSTEQHRQPNPPPKITSAAELAKFLIEHPNYAHHNLDITPNQTGAVTRSEPFSSGSIRQQWTFGIQVVNCKGFTVSFSSGQPVRGGSVVKLAPTTVPQNEQITLTVDNVDIPENWNTMFNFTYEQNGLTPPDFSVTFLAYHQPSVDSELYELARTAEQLHIPPGSVSAGFRGIEVGSIGVMCGSVGAPR